MSAHALSTPVRTVCAGAASWASEAASIVWPKARPNSFAGVQQLSAVHPLSGREWTEDGQLWVQYVSSTPATRLDVINLQEQLDQRLLQRQARETGICPVREELYAQCFDELIRQVPLGGPREDLGTKWRASDPGVGSTSSGEKVEAFCEDTPAHH